MENLEEAKRRLKQRLFHLTNLSFVKTIHIQHNEHTSVRVDTAAGALTSRSGSSARTSTGLWLMI